VVEDVVSSRHKLYGAPSVQGFRTSMAYDVLTRLPLVVWFALCGWAMWTRFSAYWIASLPWIRCSF
jgi:hypothetical protein